ncbi:coatomer subunit delta [Rhizina undulata]
MQLGHKSKTTEIFEKIRRELGGDAEEHAPLVGTPAADSATSVTRSSFTADKNAVQVTLSERITSELTREGAPKSFEVKGDLQLRISDTSLTKVSLNLSTASDGKIQFRTHPKRTLRSLREVLVYLRKTAKVA